MTRTWTALFFIVEAIALLLISITLQSYAQAGPDRANVWRISLLFTIVAFAVLACVRRRGHGQILALIPVVQLGVYLRYETESSVETSTRGDRLLNYPAVLYSAWLAVRSRSRPLLACAAAAAMLSGCGPIYTASQTYTLARNLQARPLDIEFDLRGMPVRLEVDDSIVEGTVVEVDVEALRIGQTWFPIERMRDPGDNFIRNMFTVVRYQTRFIDADTGELIDRFIDANRIRRIRISEQWYEMARIRFLDSPRFDDPDRWIDQRVRARTRNRTYEGLIVPIDSGTFSIDGEVLAVSDLESFETVTRCFECEGGRGFLFMAMAPFLIIGSLIAACLLLARRLMRKK